MTSTYFKRIVQSEVQEYLVNHEDSDEKDLVLQHKKVLGIPIALLAQQISGRRKAKSKLALWYKTKGIVYPPSVNIEQCSSEATARFKTRIAQSILSDSQNPTIADLTGGFGVDSYFFSLVFDSVHYVEPNDDLFQIVSANHRTLQVKSIVHHQTTAEDFIATRTKVDLVYIDPSRRDSNSRKVFRLADCTPDISSLQETIFEHSRFLLVKASPLLDIQQGLRELTHTKKVFVVSVNNECKELLFLCEKNYTGHVQIEAVDLFVNGDLKNVLSFLQEEEKNAISVLGEAAEYLYEPNASILKAGAFKLISEKFQLVKLAPNTHLYTSSLLIKDFPGRVFQIEVLDPDVKELKRFLPNGKANVLTRNYPLKAEELKKKLKLTDGGEKYVIGFSVDNYRHKKKKHLAICCLPTKTQ
jgi:hypothetical protein